MADGQAEGTRLRSAAAGAPAARAGPREVNHEHEDERPIANAAAPAGVLWSDLWQVPTILISVVLIVAGLFIAMQRAPQNDFEAALVQVEEFLGQGLLEEAGLGLANVLEPHLDLAAAPERARFHACVADWLSMAQERENVDREENNVRIHQQYTRATDLGLQLTPARTERWGHSLISLGRLDEAQRRIAELDAMVVSEPGHAQPGDVHERRGRLFRRVVERMLAKPEINEQLLGELLAAYRASPNLSLAEQAWVMARQAELRIETGRPQHAIDHLLVDMRRLEHEAGTRPLDASELYALLGRAYYDFGRFQEAKANLERVLVEPRSGAAARSMAHVLLGRLAAADADLEKAFEHFDYVVRDYPGMRGYLAAILGRAEVQSALGEHEASRDDYRRLAQMLTRPVDRPDVTPVRAGASLIDRHDAALARGDLDIALSYIQIAETLFAAADVPVDVLLRIATTSRQLADDLIATISEREGKLERSKAVVLLHDANMHYRRAGEYFVRHARGLVAIPGRDQDWATSLWNGADSFDLGGHHELAIRHFEEYLAGRSQQDPRRSEATFRLAQCYHGLLEYERAAKYYELVIADHPRSAEATRSYVPLAQCYVALGRRPEAEQHLNQVLAGLLPIQPSAADYRNALIQLANIQYQSRNHAAAIPRYHEAVERYPDDPRRLEMQFRLADSYRSLALEIAERLRSPSPDPPGERRRLEEMRWSHFRKAMETFARVSAGFDDRDPARLEPEERDLQRLADLYHADCAFFLGEYERAIELYDRAARKYADHHSSMHALVQIVNSYSALGDADRAAAAHRRALLRLEQLRADAFAAPDALMDRQAWERWLANAPVIGGQRVSVDVMQ